MCANGRSAWQHLLGALSSNSTEYLQSSILHWHWASPMSGLNLWFATPWWHVRVPIHPPLFYGLQQVLDDAPPPRTNGKEHLAKEGYHPEESKHTCHDQACLAFGVCSDMPCHRHGDDSSDSAVCQLQQTPRQANLLHKTSEVQDDDADIYGQEYGRRLHEMVVKFFHRILIGSCRDCYDAPQHEYFLCIDPMLWN